MAKINPIPAGFRTITPNLVVNDATEAIEFYRRAFGAEVSYPAMTGPDGKVMHAELRIGDSVLMLNDEMQPPQKLPVTIKSPRSAGCTTSTLLLYVKDADSVFDRAIKAGCTVVMPLENQFWGDRYGSLVDPYGVCWSIATHIEDVSRSETEKRAAAAFAKTT